MRSRDWPKARCWEQGLWASRNWSDSTDSRRWVGRCKYFLDLGRVVTGGAGAGREIKKIAAGKPVVRGVSEDLQNGHRARKI